MGLFAHKLELDVAVEFFVVVAPVDLFICLPLLIILLNVLFQFFHNLLLEDFLNFDVLKSTGSIKKVTGQLLKDIPDEPVLQTFQATLY